MQVKTGRRQKAVGSSGGIAFGEAVLLKIMGLKVDFGVGDRFCCFQGWFSLQLFA
jgi:hypothetical protein